MDLRTFISVILLSTAFNALAVTADPSNRPSYYPPQYPIQYSPQHPPLHPPQVIDNGLIAQKQELLRAVENGT